MSTVILSCGDCKVAAREGLVCRVRGQDGEALLAPASWDEESKRVACCIPKERAVPHLDYEVLDAHGNVVCRSTGGAGAAVCCKPEVLGPCTSAACQRSCAIDEVAAAGAGAGGAAASGPAAQLSAREVLRRMSWVDKLLPLWIVAAMVLGVLLGYYVPSVKAGLAVAEVGGVSLPIALGLWWMMWPVLTKVRYELLGLLLAQRQVARALGISLALNWVVGPALMTGLAWACLPDLPGYRNGVILVGLARCIAMVLIWNQLAGGQAELCAVMVALNSVLQVVLYAPLSMLYLNVVSGAAGISVGFWPVAKSVLLFLGVPLVAGIVLRYAILATAGARWFEQVFMRWFGPTALLGLLYTIIVMFAAQGDKIINDIGNVARVAVPMLVYFLIMFATSLAAAWWARASYAYAVTQAFTAASNNFELAIAVAVGTFGIQSQEALAATVGPLIEVPVLLALVYAAILLQARAWGRRDAWLLQQGLYPRDLHEVVAAREARRAAAKRRGSGGGSGDGGDSGGASGAAMVREVAMVAGGCARG